MTLFFRMIPFPLCLFWQLKLKICCASPAADVQWVLCQDAGQQWEAARLLQGEWRRSRSSCSCGTCLMLEMRGKKPQKTCKTMLKIVLVTHLILNAVKTLYSQNLHNPFPECQLWKNLHSISQPVTQVYRRHCYFHWVCGNISFPLGCSIYYTEFRISIFMTHIHMWR